MKERREAVSAVLHQLEHGEAATGDLRDIEWCARELRRVLYGNLNRLVPYTWLGDEESRERLRFIDSLDYENCTTTAPCPDGCAGFLPFDSCAKCHGSGVIDVPVGDWPAATDYACPRCHADKVLADRTDRVGICAECGWFGPVGGNEPEPRCRPGGTPTRISDGGDFTEWPGGIEDDSDPPVEREGSVE